MKLKLFALATLGILGLTTCEKTPDPCAAMKPVSADFDLYDGTVKTDTFWSPATVTFKAKDSTAQSYEWSFPDGANTNDKRSFSLAFNNETGKIDVQLILKNKPQTACFPKDDGIDTVQKSVFLISYYEPPQYVGTFIGSDDTNPSHKFEVTIANFGMEQPDLEPKGWYTVGIRIFNIPEGCGGGRINIYSYSPGIRKIGSTYKTFVFSASNFVGNGCAAVEGKGIMINKDKIVIDYSFIVWNSTKKDWDIVKRKFTGYRKK